MEPIFIVIMISLIFAAIVVIAIAVPAIRRRDTDQEFQVGSLTTTLAPWEVDQQLPVVPAEMTTQAIPIVPLPSGKNLSSRDVSERYPEAAIGAHRQRREFGVATTFPGPRHGR